jgi:hypothetical protein
MKKKIIGMFVCMLMIVPIVQVTATTTPSPTPLDRDMIDQYMDVYEATEFIPNSAWQQFVPTKPLQIAVEVMVCQQFSGSPDLTLSIEGPLGTVLSQKSLPASQIPANVVDWVTFDIPDVTLTPGNTYYIVMSYAPGGEYSWGGAYGNKYPAGESSRAPSYPDWDWCFCTWIEETTPNIVMGVKPTWRGIEVTIRNDGGEMPGESVNVNVYVNSLIIFRGDVSSLPIPIPEPAMTATARTGAVMGFGRATITVELVYNDEIISTEETKGVLFVLLVAGLPIPIP